MEHLIRFFVLGLVLMQIISCEESQSPDIPQFVLATGTFLDERDGQEYKWTKIGDQVWMAENLAYDIGEGCFDYCRDVTNYSMLCAGVLDADSLVSTYGILYNWETAKIACPEGWHLPTDEEWKQLEIFIGMNPEEVDMYGAVDKRGENIGSKLKSASGWNENGGGTNNYGFSALPGGRVVIHSQSLNIGYTGSWWTATEAENGDIWHRILGYQSSTISRYSYSRYTFYSVRCVKN